MTTFFYIKENVKHNGNPYQRGHVIQGESSEFSGLVSDGLFVELEAKSQEEAIAEAIEKFSAPTEPEPVVSENDTWGPAPDPVDEDDSTPAPTTPEEGPEIKSTPEEIITPANDAETPPSEIKVEGDPQTTTTEGYANKPDLSGANL